MYGLLDVPNKHNKHYIHRIRVFRNDRPNVYTFVSERLYQREWRVYMPRW